MAILNIRNLTVRFATATGSFTAVDGVDISVDRGEVLAIVGESGSGKSVSMLAVMGLLPDTATVTADEMTYDGRDLLAMPASERRRLIGREITMIFQEPIASLNPAFTVGFQIEEALRLNLSLGRREARAREPMLSPRVRVALLAAEDHRDDLGVARQPPHRRRVQHRPRIQTTQRPPRTGPRPQVLQAHRHQQRRLRTPTRPRVHRPHRGPHQIDQRVSPALITRTQVTLHDPGLGVLAWRRRRQRLDRRLEDRRPLRVQDQPVLVQPVFNDRT